MRRNIDRILFDRNVLLDVVLERTPHFRSSSLLVNAVEEGLVDGFVAATSVTTCFYVVEGHSGPKIAATTVKRILEFFEVAPVTKVVLERAFDLGYGDYEDAVLHEAGRLVSVTAIATRNKRDFTKATLRILTPEELLPGLYD